jgi:ADP-heptose:LPS heptosyltransferase
MGIGDQLLAAGRAKLLYKATQQPVAIGDGKNVIWCPLYDHNPYLSKEPCEHWIVDYPGHRPYLGDYTKLKRNWIMDHRAEPCQIFWGPGEEAKTGTYAVVEPNIKNGAPLAKQWPRERFQEVVNQTPITWIQFATGPPLSGVNRVTTTLREAAQWIAGAQFVLTNEGAIHHIAAAFHTPAVVLFNSFIPPQVTGYEFHKNLYIHDSEVCGYTKRPNRKLIEVEDVCESVRNIVKSKKPSTAPESTERRA